MLRASVSFATHGLFDVLNHLIQNHLLFAILFAFSFASYQSFSTAGVEELSQMIKRGGRECGQFSRRINFGAMAAAAPSDWPGLGSPMTKNVEAFDPFLMG
jgi:hypothetical protein